MTQSERELLVAIVSSQIRLTSAVISMARQLPYEKDLWDDITSANQNNAKALELLRDAK